MIRHWRYGLLALACYGSLAAAGAPGRGELLYTTHCIACHSEQVHWREKKLARNWTSLVAEVRRWQAVGNLDWGTDDIEEVARYLNIIHYRYRLPAG